ncbi:NtaA/DmoA family FMN-dependent monooxygenase [Ancylobacter sp. 6x-1]|uniref:NtaA/DmoA family FMN-dependent monooxygenase n=1 Tax=Ancylobacter crimeensis TaxID=2579147 RepID=A0ABT0DF83_9HYPH|nr:NtaA/DmoA family FMN-dependent monooxygenase [Ancylobacter crimeensis]MCK0198626.1 NtaA/DmoA family FMN-dependent monooxygenase [Ancylobacter crimeensis]
MSKPFHLALFLQGSSVQAWGAQWTGRIAETWMQPSLFLDIARSLERACFDYILLEDGPYIGESFGGSREIYLRNGISVPKQDPSVLASLMLGATSHIGIVPTLATYAYHPFVVARLVATMDQISGGRAGWNMVTGSSKFAFANLGYDELTKHDLRYDMADEYLDIVDKLWHSWDADAIVADEANGILIDHEKVHQIDFKGQYYSSRGPLNCGPAPQGRPVIAQAGGSPRGRQFAAQHADTVVTSVVGIDDMRAYRDDVRARMAAAGRNPDHCKVMFLVTPIIASNMAEAKAIQAERREQALTQRDLKLAFLGKITNIDFTKLDLDQPVGTLTTEGHQQLLDDFIRQAGKKTLREAITSFTQDGDGVELVGSPEDVAQQMGEVMQAVGGDGFLFSLPNLHRRTLAEIEDGLVPALQKRGLMRKAYAHPHLRDNLLDY